MKFLCSCLFLCIISRTEQRSTPELLYEIARPYFNLGRLQIFQRERCIEGLGCFSKKGEFFHPLFRPITVVPEDRKAIDTRFRLHTRQSPINYENITADELSISKSFYRSGRPTIILIHGFYFDNFVGVYQIEHFAELIKTILEQMDANVIFTDWGKGATTFYAQATANIRVVGAEIAALINFLIETRRAKSTDFHVIGHSLGGHTAGYVGERVRNLGKITALDPAKPFFENVPPNVKLDPNDALYVEVIHTNVPMFRNPFGLGTAKRVGDVDFYPNGANDQPGCFQQKLHSFGQGFAYGLRETVICNHGRSIEFMTAIFKQERCKFIGYKCSSYHDFELGRCFLCGRGGENCAIMGRVTSKKNENAGYYLKTLDEQPYCAYQYRVAVRLSQMPEELNNQMLSFFVTIRDQRRGAEISGSSRLMHLEQGQEHAFVIAGREEILNADRVDIGWLLDDAEYMGRLELPDRPRVSLPVTSLEITPLSYMDDSYKQKMTSRFCGLRVHRTSTAFTKTTMQNSC